MCTLSFNIAFDVRRFQFVCFIDSQLIMNHLHCQLWHAGDQYTLFNSPLSVNCLLLERFSPPDVMKKT